MKNLFIVIPLLLSVFFGVVLLVTDAELWTVAPSHAYVLIGFTVADAGLVWPALTGWRRMADFGIFWGFGKFALYLGDILTAPEFGLSYAEFAAYLFSLWGYNGLLASQALIALGAFFAKRGYGASRS
ncbi:MAG: hypothetical protein N3H84_05175 [Candidatus Caldarchaeum sp.]|nr:hypothetical protein [Candidatus Caldarchaeum sp.]MCX8201478.1 hypothetical protein [Candidatus Caldarchaeum sp.]MDW8434589.1 hypothetical protein [Candidatus Caldarchaeum sp.]